MKPHFTRTRAMLATTALLGAAATAQADNVINDDLIVTQSACIGNDCVNGESFGFDTLRLKENNLRLHFDDTSNTASFAQNDWRLVANDSGNGGGNYFAIEDATAARIPFRVEAGAIANALYVDSAGDVGIGTSSPVVEIHAVDGNSPTFRLEQDGSSGFTPQTWDLAGNETNFFIRDVTNGSKLPFRIQPNTPDQSMFMRTGGVTFNENGADWDFRLESDRLTAAFFVDGGTGRIGMGTDTPEEVLHIRTSTSNTDAFALFDASASGSDAAFMLRQNGTAPITWEFRNQESSGRLNVGIMGGNTPFKIDDLANNNLLRLGLNGQPDAVSVTGRLLVNNTQLNVPDYVFADDYALRPLADVQAFIDANAHLPETPSAAQIADQGFDMAQMQLALLKKVEELTLYTLEQEARIARMEQELAQ